MSLHSIFVRNLALPTLLRFSKCPPWQWYKRLLKNDMADTISLKTKQWEDIQSIIKYAMENVPYYKEVYANAGFEIDNLKTPEDLLTIPPIDKNQISANFPDRITSQLSDQKSWEYFATSGTTDRLMIIKDDEAISRNIALVHYEEFIQGTMGTGSLVVSIPPDVCSLTCGLRVQQPKSLLSSIKDFFKGLVEKKKKGLTRSLIGRLLRKLIYPVEELPSFGTAGTRIDQETLGWYINKIKKMRPEVLSGLPTYLQTLARHIKKTGIQPPEVGSILPQGGLTTPKMKKEISSAFQAPIHEVYGGHEFGCIASTCEKMNKMHILTPECYVEIVKNGKHVPNGELGEIVLTIFSNKAMPLIRYRPGDVGRFYDADCSCKRKTPLLTVEGRIQDTIVTSKGVFSASDVIDFYAGFDNIEFAQLVQHDEKKSDLLIVERRKNETDLQDALRKSTEFFGDEFLIRPRLVSTIKPEASGKFRFVKSTTFGKIQ